MTAREYNFDGLVGPTHNYAGLSFGNVASAQHRQRVSNPRAAALEGLSKMRRLAELGIGQALLPPHPRPAWRWLHALGFRGTREQVLDAAFRTAPTLLASAYSASNMWTANAATVSPSADCADQRLHLSPANLASMLHRSLEAPQTYRVLRELFGRGDRIRVHPPLPAASAMADEGAANHTRCCATVAGPGVELFVYGRVALDPGAATPQRFPARQTRESCQALARRHQVAERQAVFAQQHPAAIDAGVFHNDVISVGHENLLLVHELAYVDQPRIVQELATAFESACGQPLNIVEISSRELALTDAVASYLFNSQLVTRRDGRFCMICPSECQENVAARRVLQRLLEEAAPIEQVEFLNLRQSMNNGGGPACLRLRVVLTEAEQQQVHPGIFYNADLHDQLVAWVSRHYRETLAPDDLRDPELARESQAALAELATILQLPEALLADTD